MGGEEGTDSRTCEGVFHNVNVNTNMDGLIVDCTGDFDAIAGVHGSPAMCGEELFYNADVNTNVVVLITDCTGDFGTTAGMCRHGRRMQVEGEVYTFWQQEVNLGPHQLVVFLCPSWEEFQGLVQGNLCGKMMCLAR